MKKIYLSVIALCTLLSSKLNAQTTILDFEKPATSTTFQYFGSTLEPTLTAVIANPDKSGINTSDNVCEFKKPAASQSWAGAFSAPDPSTKIDMITGVGICIKVWADHTGNIALKLEGAEDGSPNWITKIPITETNKWVDICFDPNDASFEAPNNKASGHIYKRITLFLDFDVVLTEEKTWFLDDVVVKSGSVGPKKVTFNLDLKNYKDPFTKAYVSGTFNSWSGDANELTDLDGDKIYSAELSLPQGAHEYKFTFDNWKKQEEFNGLELCTITDPSGQYKNRSLAVAADVVLPAVCFNSCYACGEGVNITINLATSSVAVSPDGVYLAGGGNFDAPGGRHRMKDPDKDGIYSISFERKKGFTSFFTFANGNCPDYSCKENIAGQACANPGNFNDRLMLPVTKDTVISTCFGFCSATATCGNAPKPGNITFRVNMSEFKETFGKVYVSGTFNNWSGDANELLDTDKDKVYEVVIPNIPAGAHEYKFQLDGWAKQEQFKGGEACTITDPSGQFINRKLTINGDTVLAKVCYNSCTACSGVATKEIAATDLLRVQPTLANDMIQVLFGENYMDTDKKILVYGIDSRKSMEINVSPFVTTHIISTTDLTEGLYIIQVKAGNYSQTARFVVRH